MRGQGVDPKVLYQWAEQPNGRYTIFDVPILKPFRRELRNGVEVVVAEKDFPQIARKFDLDRKEEGYYPRVHLGHQDLCSPVNAEAIGFLDNMYSQGDMLFADLVEIDAEIFKKIEKYPYRSVEFNAETGKIDTLALLESRSPYIMLPLLILAPAPTEVEKEETILSFGRRTAALIQLGATAMAEKIDKIDEEKDEKKEIVQQEVVESDEHASDEMSKLDGLASNMEKLLGLMGKIAEKLFVEAEVEEGDGEAPAAVPPQSIAQQSADYTHITAMMQKQDATIAQLSAQLQAKQVADSYEEELVNLANSNPTINLGASKRVLASLSSDADRKVYMDSLSEGCVHFQKHIVSSIASDVKFMKDDISKAVESVGVDASPEMLQFARQAQRDYRDTLGQPNKKEAQQFATIWPSEEGFVKAMLQQEQLNPGHYKRMQS